MILYDILWDIKSPANQNVTVYQSQVKGLVDVLAMGGGTGTIFTSIKAIKHAFKRRDNQAGLY